MTWNNYSPIPQCSNLLPYTFGLVPPLLNLGSPGILHTCEQAQPYHEIYTPLGFILFIMLADHRKASLLMQELWKLGTSTRTARRAARGTQVPHGGVRPTGP